MRKVKEEQERGKREARKKPGVNEEQEVMREVKEEQERGERGKDENKKGVRVNDEQEGGR